MIGRTAALAAAAMLAGEALAQPVSTQADGRIVTRRYDPSTVVEVKGRVGIQATIQFDEGEKIENVAVGDSAAWQVTPNKRADLLFVKPVTPGARTNMTVVTDERTYLFDLVASAKAAPLYVLRFAYPPKPKPAPVAVAAAPAPRPDPAAASYVWESKGDLALVPERVFDDGRATYLAWGKEATLPAILIADAKGVEGPVNYSVEGPYIVVDGVPGKLVLRSGKQMAVLTPKPRTVQQSAAATPRERR